MNVAVIVISSRNRKGISESVIHGGGRRSRIEPAILIAVTRISGAMLRHRHYDMITVNPFPQHRLTCCDGCCGCSTGFVIENVGAGMTNIHDCISWYSRIGVGTGYLVSDEITVNI